MMANQKVSPGVGWSNKDDIAMGLMFGKKSGLELMQNCDLPPPLKVFSGLDKTVVSPPMDKYGSIAALEDNEGSENEKLELLKALRLSQTRAREAERRYEVLSKERDALSNLLLKESLQLLACQNSVRLLELQVSQLKKQQQRVHKGSDGNRRFAKEESDRKANNSPTSTLFITMAFCMGIAGVSLAFGYRYFFLF